MVYEFGDDFRSKNEAALKQFFIKTIAFLIIAFSIIQLRAIYLLNNDRYIKKNPAKDVYLSIQKSKQKYSTKKMLLGDSVARQLFNSEEDNDSITSLACNQAISIVGQFLLLKNYVDAGNRPDIVYLFCLPQSFQNNLQQKYTYNYFVKPFYNSEYLNEINSTVENSLRVVPYKYFADFSFIKTSNWSPDIKTSSDFDGALSPISADYLLKMNTLAEKYHFKLIIVPAPVSNNMKSTVAELQNSKLMNSQLKEMFKDYFSNVKIMDNNLFSDGMHFKKPEKFKKLFAQTLSMQ